MLLRIKIKVKTIRFKHRMVDRIQQMRIRRAVKALRKVKGNPMNALLALHKSSQSSVEEAFVKAHADWKALENAMESRAEMKRVQRAYDERKAARAAAKAAEEVA